MQGGRHNTQSDGDPPHEIVGPGRVVDIAPQPGAQKTPQLMAEKYDKRVRCTVRETSNTSFLDNSGLDIELVIGDLKDPVFANRALDKITTVVNFTGLS